MSLVRCSNAWVWTMFDKLIARLRTQSSVESTVHEPLRWIVLDTETTGLSLWTDHLISIAAVAVVCEPGLRSARIVLGDRFEAVIHQQKPTHKKSNILVHHIGVQAQRDADDGRQVMQRFAQWAGDAPLFAFHAPFDRAMIAKACKKFDLPEPASPWVDVAAMASCARRDTFAASLDDRLQEFGLTCFERHQASADMFATAELLMRLLPILREQVQDFRGLLRICADQARSHA